MLKSFRLIRSKFQENWELIIKFEILYHILTTFFYLIVWSLPHLFSPDFIYSMGMLMVFEFIMVHSGVFMLLFVPYSILFFLPFYSIFAVAFNSIIPNDLVFFIFSTTILLRLKDGIINDEALRSHTFTKAIINAFLIYMPFAFLGVICSSFIPEWGLTEDFLNSINYYSSENRKQIAPHYLVCFGFFYFLALVYVEVKLTLKIIKEKEEQNTRTIKSSMEI